MKKSEAIGYIADWLSGARNGNGTTTNNDKINALELLNIVENELGMVPPMIVKYVQQEEWGVFPTRIHEWEPEGEE